MSHDPSTTPDPRAHPAATDPADLITRLEALQKRNHQLEQVFWLAAHDVVFFSTYNEATGAWDDRWHAVINLNDTFDYAAADADALPLDKIDEVVDLYRRFGEAGVIAWSARRREMEPLPPLRNAQYQAACQYLAGLGTAGAVNQEEKPMS